MPPLPKIRGTQVGLRSTAVLEAIKSDMRSGRYRFDDPAGQIGGVLDPSGTYHIMEGHHRMAAALELFRETGEDRFVLDLLDFGRWVEALAPRSSRPMPGRSWLKWIRNRIGY